MNVASIVGYLGQDVNFGSKGDTDYANLSVATTEYWNDDDGQRQERTDWHRVVAFGGLARCIQNLKTGSRVAVTGKLRQGRYEKDGTVHRTTEIVAREIDILHWVTEEEETAKKKKKK